MRVSRETAVAHRAAMVAAASRLFRARGLDRVGVAEITRAAGLTHGGFYGHFASKDALAAEAVTAAFDEGRSRLESGSLEDYLKGYLSRFHRDHPESGCPIPSLGADVLQADAAVGRPFVAGVDRLTAALAARLEGGEAGDRQARATALVALLIGGLTLARARAASDREGSDRLLKALRAQALELAGLGAAPPGPTDPGVAFAPAIPSPHGSPVEETASKR